MMGTHRRWWHQLVESSESGGVGAAAVIFFIQVIPKSTSLISYPF